MIWATYLSSFRAGETVYYLSAKGRRQIGSQTVRRRTQTAQHTILRNEIIIAKRPEYWRLEYSVKWDGKQIVADALLRKDGAFNFVEVDLTQSMAANERKIAAYRELRDSGRWQARYGEFPAILYVTTTEYRRTRLMAALSGMKAEVLIFNDLK